MWHRQTVCMLMLWIPVFGGTLFDLCLFYMQHLSIKDVTIANCNFFVVIFPHSQALIDS